MLPNKVKMLVEKYCMGIKPTNEQLDEIMEAAFAEGADSQELGEYVEALQNGPTKEMVEAEKLKKEAEEHKKKINEHKEITRNLCLRAFKSCEDEKEIREYLLNSLIAEAEKEGASPDEIAEIENIIDKSIAQRGNKSNRENKVIGKSE